MKSILITGANSYIGTSFEKWVAQWPDEYTVDTVDMIGDGWKEKSFTGYDVVFHVAGIAHVKETKKNRALYFKINRDLACETAQKAKAEGVRHFIFLSSMSVYGLEKGIIHADTLPAPKTAYGKSKYEAEGLMNDLSDESFIVSILRPPMVYGRGCKGNYPRLARLVLKMPFFPNIENRRSMIYIDNLSQFVMQLIDDPRDGLLFPQNLEYVNTMEMARYIAEAHNKTIKKTRAFNTLLNTLNIGMVNKVFGSLTYDMSMSEQEKKYTVCNFGESIIHTEAEKKDSSFQYLNEKNGVDNMNNCSIWFFHHYATPPSIIGLTRPFDFSKELLHQGHKCSIFTSSFLHYAGYYIASDKALITERSEEGVLFNYVRSSKYKNSKNSRVLNMLSFYFNLFRAARKKRKSDKPDVIIASSPHPLTCVAGIKIARRLGIPCIVEVRDLWPQSIFAYESMSATSLLARILYAGEKWIYKKADAIVFTMVGGKDYVIERKWDIDNGGPINLNKVYHINNGVDIDAFDKNARMHRLDDGDLSESNTYKVVYAGSIRKMNNIKLLIDAAKYVQESKFENIKFIIFGDGTEKEQLEIYCKKNAIDNVMFKGNVEKKYIPYILSCTDLNILHYNGKSIWKYGGSQNKIFEYLASGKPILSTIQMGYDIIERYGCGESLKNQDYQSIGNAIIKISQLEKEKYLLMCENAKKASLEYDFKKLTEKLTEVIESVRSK